MQRKQVYLCDLTIDSEETGFLSSHYNENTATLDLSSQSITDQHIPRIIEFIHNHPNIRTLELGLNNITDLGAHSIATLHDIKELDLSYNNITHKGIEALVGMPNLRRFNIIGNNIGPKGEELFENKAHAMKSQMKMQIHALEHKQHKIRHQLIAQKKKLDERDLKAKHAQKSLDTDKIKRHKTHHLNFFAFPGIFSAKQKSEPERKKEKEININSLFVSPEEHFAAYQARRKFKEMQSKIDKKKQQKDVLYSRSSSLN